MFNNAPRDKVNRNAARCANQKIDPICRTPIDGPNGYAQYGEASEMAFFHHRFQSLMYQVEKFCGASNGWRSVGRARSHSQASELRRKVEAIRPDFISRVRCVSPELFPL